MEKRYITYKVYKDFIHQENQIDTLYYFGKPSIKNPIDFTANKLFKKYIVPYYHEGVFYIQAEYLDIRIYKVTVKDKHIVEFKRGINGKY